MRSEAHGMPLSHYSSNAQTHCLVPFQGKSRHKHITTNGHRMNVLVPTTKLVSELSLKQHPSTLCDIGPPKSVGFLPSLTIGC